MENQRVPRPQLPMGQSAQWSAYDTERSLLNTPFGNVTFDFGIGGYSVFAWLLQQEHTFFEHAQPNDS